MAGKVGVKHSEYETLKQAIKGAHDDSIEQIKAAIKQLEAINGNGNGFYTASITPKVSAVIQEVQAMASSITAVYDAHETIVESFESAIDNYDTLC